MLQRLAIQAGTAVLDYFTGGLIPVSAPFISDSKLPLDSLFSLFDLFGGGSSFHLPAFRPSHYKRPHNPECGFIGVYGGSCADEAPPRYSMGQITPIAWNNEYTKNLKIPYGPVLQNPDPPYAEIRKAPTVSDQPKCPPMDMPSDWADPVTAGIMAGGYAGSELGGFYGGVAGGVIGGIMGMYTSSYLTYGCQ